MLTIQPASPRKDVIIVGSRCSGSSLAIHLARQGHRVLLLDKAAFPSDTLSTHVTFSNTTAMLEELGVLGEIRALGAPPVRKLRIAVNDDVIEGEIPSFAGFNENYCIRRVHFDRILIDAAAACPGVEIRENFEVRELLCDSKGNVCGVSGRGPTGQTESFQARLVVGADGHDSFVRKEVRAAYLFSEASRVSAFYAYFSGFTDLEPMFRILRRGRFRAGLFPTTDGLHVLQIFIPHDEREWVGAFMSSPEESMKRLLCWIAPDLASHVLASTIEGPVRSLLKFRNDRHQAVGPGWALVGDALSFKDPAVGQGMHDALASSRILASILARIPDWRSSSFEIRREFEAKFYTKIAERFEAALSVSRAAPLTSEQALRFTRIAADPAATQRYLGFLNYRYNLSEVESTGSFSDHLRVVQPA
jgi:2-polyprenyl-6-methoxyphenol hydroxylase-like FAD-dependent oxidoreductase